MSAIERIQRRVARVPEGLVRGEATRRLSGLLAIADQMIACVPPPSPTAMRAARSTDGMGAGATDVPSASDTGPAEGSDRPRNHSADSFDPAEALQDLHGQVIQLEAMTHAASEAVTQLPFPSDREARRAFDRAYALVTKVADETNALVRYGDDLISALAAYLKRRRAEADGAPTKPS